MLVSELRAVSSEYIISEGALTERDLTEITVDSREVGPETVFFAIKGSRTDGNNFIDAALQSGAGLVIGEKELRVENYIQAKDIHKLLIELSPIFYGDPQTKMDFVGITGTNGKTTTSYMAEKIIECKKKVGVIGTIGYKFDGKTLKAPNTTPFPWTWYKLLRDMRRSGTEVVISEVSSHALDQERIEGTFFDAAVFTNFTRDHIDYHKTEEEYFSAKEKLFTKYLKKNGLAVINIDDPKGIRMLSSVPAGIEKLTFSFADKNADLYIYECEAHGLGSKISMNFRGKTLKADFAMMGRFNVANMASAILACSRYCEVEDALKILSGGLIVPGRMERVGSWGRIYIDYAHSPDALENILKTVVPAKGNGKLAVVFGAGGDRDKGKRPLMGAAACRYADLIIVTTDNPRSEEPSEIIKEIVGGISDKAKLIVIADRSEAIKKAVELVDESDILVIAGKGAEDYQIFKDKTIYFSDRDEVNRYVGELK